MSKEPICEKFKKKRRKERGGERKYIQQKMMEIIQIGQVPVYLFRNIP